MRGSVHDRGTIREFGTVSQYENKGHRLRIYASANVCYRLLQMHVVAMLVLAMHRTHTIEIARSLPRACGISMTGIG